MGAFNLLRVVYAVAALVFGTALVAPVAAQSPAAAKSAAPAYRVVVQVSDSDPKTWNQALNNARNFQTEVGRQNIEMEIVVYGNGIEMLKLESEVGGRVKDAIDGGIRVVACENTMAARRLKRDDMLPYVGYVKAGIVQIVDRQREGYVYVRP